MIMRWTKIKTTPTLGRRRKLGLWREWKTQVARKLRLAAPDEAGKPIRKDGKLLPFRYGEISPRTIEHN